MPAITIRNLPPVTYRALQRRAAANGRSVEAEIRDILENALRPAGRLTVGSALAALGQRFGGVEIDVRRDRADWRHAIPDFD